jgi:hypothetical protein
MTLVVKVMCKKGRAVFDELREATACYHLIKINARLSVAMLGKSGGAMREFR